jgi:hypothetical protein
MPESWVHSGLLVIGTRCGKNRGTSTANRTYFTSIADDLLLLYRIALLMPSASESL